MDEVELVRTSEVQGSDVGGWVLGSEDRAVESEARFAEFLGGDRVVLDKRLSDFG